MQTVWTRPVRMKMKAEMAIRKEPPTILSFCFLLFFVFFFRSYIKREVEAREEEGRGKKKGCLHVRLVQGSKVC